MSIQVARELPSLVRPLLPMLYRGPLRAIGCSSQPLEKPSGSVRSVRLTRRRACPTLLELLLRCISLKRKSPAGEAEKSAETSRERIENDQNLGQEPRKSMKKHGKSIENASERSSFPRSGPVRVHLRREHRVYDAARWVPQSPWPVLSWRAPWGSKMEGFAPLRCLLSP